MVAERSLRSSEGQQRSSFNRRNLGSGSQSSSDARFSNCAQKQANNVNFNYYTPRINSEEVQDKRDNQHSGLTTDQTTVPPFWVPSQDSPGNLQVNQELFPELSTTNQDLPVKSISHGIPTSHRLESVVRFDSRGMPSYNRIVKPRSEQVADLNSSEPVQKVAAQQRDAEVSNSAPLSVEQPPLPPSPTPPPPPPSTVPPSPPTDPYVLNSSYDLANRTFGGVQNNYIPLNSTIQHLVISPRMIHQLQAAQEWELHSTPSLGYLQNKKSSNNLSRIVVKDLTGRYHHLIM